MTVHCEDIYHGSYDSSKIYDTEDIENSIRCKDTLKNCSGLYNETFQYPVAFKLGFSLSVWNPCVSSIAQQEVIVILKEFLVFGSCSFIFKTFHLPFG